MAGESSDGQGYTPLQSWWELMELWENALAAQGYLWSVYQTEFGGGRGAYLCELGRCPIHYLLRGSCREVR